MIHTIQNNFLTVQVKNAGAELCSIKDKAGTEYLFDAKVSLRQIEARQQSPDHPILWNVPETNYLKFYLFQVV